MAKLQMPKLSTSMKAWNKKGELVDGYDIRPSHSWCRGAYNLLFSAFSSAEMDDATWGAGLLSTKMPDGSIQTSHTCAGTYTAAYNSGTPAIGSGYRGAAAYANWGIGVGTGDAAESFEDFELATLIEEGTGAGQMSYTESETNVKSWNAGTLTWRNTVSRYINNNSGGAITIKEMGLYHTYTWRVSPSALNNRVLAARDVLAAPVSVPDAGQLLATYYVDLVFPE